MVLPDPERPTSATSSPGATSRTTPRRACTAGGPEPKVRVHAPRRDTIGSAGRRRHASSPRSERISTWSRSSASRTRRVSSRASRILARHLHPPGAVHHRVLLGDDAGAVRVVPGAATSLLVRPSRIATVRATWPLTAGSWVTTTTVAPGSRFAVRSASNTSCARRRCRARRWARRPAAPAVVGERDGDRDPLLLAAGHLAAAAGRRTCPTPSERRAARRPARPLARGRRRRSVIGRSTICRAVR